MKGKKGFRPNPCFEEDDPLPFYDMRASPVEMSTGKTVIWHYINFGAMLRGYHDSERLGAGGHSVRFSGAADGCFRTSTSSPITNAVLCHEAALVFVMSVRSLAGMNWVYSQASQYVRRLCRF